MSLQEIEDEGCEPIIEDDQIYQQKIEAVESPKKCLTYDPDVIEFEEVKTVNKSEEVKPKSKPIKPTIIEKPTTGNLESYGEKWAFSFESNDKW
jgi:hypothetical protein